MKLKILVVAFLSLICSVASAQEDPHHPGSFDCSAQLNAGTLFPTMAVQASGGATTTPIPSGSLPTQTSPGCSQYNYVQVSGTYNSVTITPTFGGPNIITSDWDCSHSMMNYVVYNANASGVYSKVGFGQLYGRVVGNTCVHDVSAFASSGTNSVSLTAMARNPIIGLYSWNHNDADFGHPGNLCSADNCYWGSSLTVSGQASVSNYYSSWVTAPDAGPFEPVDQYGPTFVSKKSWRIWAFAVPYDNSLYRRTWAGLNQTNWLGWDQQTQTNLASVPSGCNWLASGGFDEDRNVVVAYVGWDKKVHVGVAMGSVTDFAWNVMNDTTDNAAQPVAVACGDGVLTLAVKKENGTVAFKRNTRITYNHYSFSEWGSSWTTVQMPTTGPLAGHQIAGGVAAARTATNTITLAASEMDVNFNASTSCIMTNIVNGIPGKWGVVTSGGCQQEKYSTPSMTSLDNGGARILVTDEAIDGDPGTITLRTATSGNGTTWSSFKFGKGVVPASANCLHATSRPTIVQSKSSGEITIGSACDHQGWLRTVVIPTP